MQTFDSFHDVLNEVVTDDPKRIEEYKIDSWLPKFPKISVGSWQEFHMQNCEDGPMPDLLEKFYHDKTPYWAFTLNPTDPKGDDWDSLVEIRLFLSHNIVVVALGQDYGTFIVGYDLTKEQFQRYFLACASAPRPLHFNGVGGAYL